MPEDKKEEGKIILETAMKCPECRFVVYKAIVSYPGVEDVNIDLKSNKATLKAPKVDAKKLFESAKKKSQGKITKLLYPDPNEVKKEDKKKEPVEVTVILKVGMDCASHKEKIEKAAWSIKDVYSVKATGEDTLTIKGLDLDAKKVCEVIRKKSRKHTEVVPPKKDDQKKDDQKKDDKKEDGGKKDDKKEDGGKKDEKPEPKIVTYYVYPPQYFSDENANACTIM